MLALSPVLVSLSMPRSFVTHAVYMLVLDIKWRQYGSAALERPGERAWANFTAAERRVIQASCEEVEGQMKM